MGLHQSQAPTTLQFLREDVVRYLSCHLLLPLPALSGYPLGHPKSGDYLEEGAYPGL